MTAETLWNGMESESRIEIDGVGLTMSQSTFAGLRVIFLHLTVDHLWRHAPMPDLLETFVLDKIIDGMHFAIKADLVRKGGLKVNSEREHILIEMATKYHLRKVTTGPANFHYSWKLGTWLHDKSNDFYARSGDRKPPQTKKADVETGEDQKGE